MEERIEQHPFHVLIPATGRRMGVGEVREKAGTGETRRDYPPGCPAVQTKGVG